MEKSPSGVNQQENTNLTKEECAYIAGIIDGEGSLRNIWRVVNTREKPYRQVTPVIVIANTSKTLLDYLVLIFDRSNIGYYVAWSDRNKRWKPIWSICISGFKRVSKLLPQIMPYLTVKKELAESLNSFCNMRLARGRKSYSKIELELMLKTDELQERGRSRYGVETRLHREIRELLRDYTQEGLIINPKI